MTVACVADFVRLAEADLAKLDGGELGDQDLADVMTAALRLYAARTEARDAFPAPLTADKVTATEVATVVSEMVGRGYQHVRSVDVARTAPRPEVVKERRFNV